MPRGLSWVLITLSTLVSTVAVWYVLGLNTVRQNFDGPYYAVVAQSWYVKDVIRTQFSFPLPLEYYPAHFPLFPALMAVIAKITTLSFLDAGLLVNLLASIATALVVYYIAFRNHWGNPVYLAIIWLFFWPRIWAVRSVASPETLFILLTMLSLWWFDKQKYWLAAIAGSLALLTKSPGILLFVAYSVWFLIEYFKHNKLHLKIWPVILIPITLVGLFGFFYRQTGDFWAYFNSGDNIHLQVLPFKIFDSSQPWVGDFWLEDVLWIYLIGAIGTYYLYSKNKVFGTFAAVFYSTILFVSHRDISRYALPIAPFVIFGLSHVLNKKAVRLILLVLVIPCFFYTLNFLSHNQVAISDWAPFFAR